MSEIAGLSWTPLTNIPIVDYERYRENVAATEPFDASATLSWLRRDGAPPDDFFVVGTAGGKIAADLEFYRDGDSGTLRFDLSGEYADSSGYTSLLELGLSKVTAKVRSVKTSSAQSLELKCEALTESGFREDGQTVLLSAETTAVRLKVPRERAGVTISRLRREEDLSSFSKLHNAVFETVPGARQIAFNDMRDMVTETLKADHSIYLAEIESALVGWIWSGIEIERGSHQLFIESIGVHPDYCRQGIGSSLLSVALAEVCKTDVVRVFASVDRRNNISLQFFSKCGLRTESVTNWYARRLQR